MDFFFHILKEELLECIVRALGNTIPGHFPSLTDWSSLPLPLVGFICNSCGFML